MLEKKKERVREKYSIWKEARLCSRKGERKVYCKVKNRNRPNTQLMALMIDQSQILLPFYFWQDFPGTFVKCVQISGANDPMSFSLPVMCHFYLLLLLLFDLCLTSRYFSLLPFSAFHLPILLLYPMTF